MKLARWREQRATAEQRQATVRHAEGNLAIIEPAVPVGPWAPIRPWLLDDGAFDHEDRVLTPITSISRRSAGSDQASACAVQAEVRTKRFGDGAVERERYGATVVADTASPYAMLAALVDALGACPDFRRGAGPDEPLILEITLRR